MSQPRTLMVTGVGLLVAAAVVIGFAVTRGDDDPGSAGPSATAGTTAPRTPSITELGTARAVAAKCMAPTAAMAQSQPFAFEGRVTTIENGLVTLEPTRFFVGAKTDLVTVNEPDQAMSESPVPFEVGEAYIVGATEGQVSICGLSGPATPRLRALYEQAFSS
ncbi:MAG: hypothetical protein JWQ74_2956 [Marmoricola sp.]|nr:hypothetical protein [Marmoricola sp.]